VVIIAPDRRHSGSLAARPSALSYVTMTIEKNTMRIKFAVASE
jgi:hypothetical protein